MTACDRQKIVRSIMSAWGMSKEADLLNALQGAGKVSSECIDFEDVPDCDLMRVYNATQYEEAV